MKDVEIFVIAGSSGCGKDTLTEDIPSLSYLKDLDSSLYNELAYKVVPFTTRDARPGEIDGVHYDFIKDKDSFLQSNYAYTQNFKKHFPPGTEYWDLEFYEERKYKVITETGEDKIDYYGNFIGNVVPGKKYVIIGQFDTYEKLRLHIKNLDRIFGFEYNEGPQVRVKLIWLTLPLKVKIHRLVKRENEKENPNIEELIRRIVSDEITMPSSTIQRDLFYKILDSKTTGEDLNDILKNVVIFNNSEYDIDHNKIVIKSLLRHPDYFKNFSLFQDLKNKIILDESI